MIIDTSLLFLHNANITHHFRGNCIFFQDQTPKYYYQILEGCVRLSTTFDDGKEFVHGYPFEGHCFGENYLFSDKNYAVSAFAETKCTIIRLEKTNFLALINENGKVAFDVFKYTSDRLHFRYIISSLMTVNDPAVKVQTLLKYLKSYFRYDELSKFTVPYTRKQIALLTGLRLETVVRVIKKMERAGDLKIQNKKIIM